MSWKHSGLTRVVSNEISVCKSNVVWHKAYVNTDKLYIETGFTALSPGQAL